MVKPSPRGESHRLGHVLTLAGPSCVGKSTLATGLLAGHMPRLAATLGLTKGVVYHLLTARESQRLEPLSGDGLLFHYDFTRRAFHANDTMDRTLTILERAERVTFLTLWEYPRELRTRVNNRFGRILADHLRNARVRPALRAVGDFLDRLPFFADPGRMWPLYQRWFDFSLGFEGSPHWILRTSGVDRPSPLTRAWDVALWQTDADAAPSTAGVRPGQSPAYQSYPLSSQ